MSLYIPLAAVVIAIVLFGGLIYLTRSRRYPRRDIIIVPTANPEGTKFCRDCRWASQPSNPFEPRDFAQAKCMHSTSVKMRGEFLASGQYDPDRMHYCAVMRTSNTADSCGDAGQYWEPRQD